MSTPDRSQRRARQQGLSIVELMVGILVALLVGLAAAGSATFFTASQRQGMGAGGALVTSTITLASIKEDAAQAGLGFFADLRYLCGNGLNLSVEANNLSTATFAPIRVERTDEVDALSLVYATDVAAGAHVELVASSDGSSASLATYLPADDGQAVLLAPADDDADACTMRTVTSWTEADVATKTPQILNFDDSAEGVHNKVPFGAAAAYPVNGRVLLVGDLQWHTYEVQDGNLVMIDRMDAAAAPVVLVRNVIGFRVQYGQAEAGQTSVAEWVEPDTVDMNDPADMITVRALRVGIATRSPQPEKQDAESKECVTTTDKVDLMGHAIEPDDVGGVSWKCFRYRSTTVVVPLRNVAMGLR